MYRRMLAVGYAPDDVVGFAGALLDLLRDDLESRLPAAAE